MPRRYPPAQGWVAFLFSSYLLGHFLFFIGSWLDNLAYDPPSKHDAQGANHAPSAKDHKVAFVAVLQDGCECSGRSRGDSQGTLSEPDWASHAVNASSGARLGWRPNTRKLWPRSIDLRRTPSSSEASSPSCCLCWPGRCIGIGGWRQARLSLWGWRSCATWNSVSNRRNRPIGTSSPSRQARKLCPGRQAIEFITVAISTD